VRANCQGLGLARAALINGRFVFRANHLLIASGKYENARPPAEPPPRAERLRRFFTLVPRSHRAGNLWHIGARLSVPQETLVLNQANFARRGGKLIKVN
jgi:hypothetical protein